MSRPRLSVALAVMSSLVLAACSSGGPASEPSTLGSPTTASPTQSSIATASPVEAAALVPSLPDGCEGGVPSAADTVAFVASGRAWAVATDGTGLVCLFETSDPGPFAWGPQGDRVLLDGLAVQGVGSSAERPAGTAAPTYFSWGRPVGKAIVFSEADQVEKAPIGSSHIEDITPLAHANAYRDVSYHPSGLAIGFIAKDASNTEGEGIAGYSIWMSSNTGADAKRLVWSKTGTVFGALAFDEGGDQLFYAVHPKDGTPMVARLLLKEGNVEEGLWLGDPATDVLSIAVAPPAGLPAELDPELPHAAAIDVGTGCADRKAMMTLLTQDPGIELLPLASGPTSVVGWLDSERVLVAEGGCDGPVDLWVADTAGGAPVLLASEVDMGAVRTIASGETPPLPDIGIKGDFA